MRLRTPFLISALVAPLFVGCSDDTTETDEPDPVPADEIDLVVDANHDGVAKLDDPEDQNHEDEWSALYIAAFLPNIDDDDMNKVLDAADEVINGEADVYDLARIVIRPWKAAPAGATATLTIDEYAVGHVRVHRILPGNVGQLVAGAVGPCGLNGDLTCTNTAFTLTTEDLKNGVELGIEARHFAGSQDARRVMESIGVVDPNDPRCKDPNKPQSLTDTCTWSGVVQLELAGKDANGKPILTKSNPVDGIDRARMHVSPWVANHNLRPFTQVIFSEASNALVSTLSPAVQEFSVQPVTFPPNNATGWDDWWFEDWMQTGWTAMPSPNGLQGMEVFNPRPWGRPAMDWPPQSDTEAQLWLDWHPVSFLRNHMLGPDRGVAVFYDEGPPQMSILDRVVQTEHYAGDSFDSHGNHDALPPWTHLPDAAKNAPMGRILTGSGVLETTKSFYWSQMQTPIHVDTSWLAVGHIDEVVAPVAANNERGWKLLINTPSLARQMFLDLEMQGKGASVIFPGKGNWGGHLGETTVAEAVGDSVLMTWNQDAQVRVDAIRAQLIAEASLAPEEIIDIPVLYEDIIGKIAWLPDTANVRVIHNGNVGVFATTQGPIVDGQDAMKAWLETNLGMPASGLGSEGQGLTVRFGDSWAYHVALGDIHCASNWTAPPTIEEPMWWSAWQ